MDPKARLTPPKHLSYYASDLPSLKTTEQSVKTITHSLAGKKPSFERDGTFNAEGWFKKYEVEIPSRAALQIESMKLACDTYEHKEPVGLLYYKKIAQLLDDRKIPCVVYIPPLPEPVATYLPYSPRPNFATWEKEIGRIFPNIVNLALPPHGHPAYFFCSDLEHLKSDASAKILTLEVIPRSRIHFSLSEY